MMQSRYSRPPEDLEYFKDMLIETEYAGEIVREITEPMRMVSIKKMIIAMPWTNTPMEDLAALHISWKIIDKTIFDRMSGTIFDFSIRDMFPEIVGKVIAEGNKMMHYKYELKEPISVLPYCNSWLTFYCDKPMKFIFSMTGYQRRPA